MEERISKGEAWFERWRKRIGLAAAPALALLVWLSGDDDPAGRLAAVMTFTACLWITEALPLAVTGLVAACLVVVTGIATPKQAFAPFATPLLFLFVGSFFIAEAMRVHGLGDRMARAAAGIARSKRGILAGLSGVTFVLSLWISNTAATAVALPIAVAVARGDRRFGAAMVLSIAYGASMGGIGTPIGTPPNLIGIASIARETGTRLSFFEWVALGLPIAAVMLVVLWGMLFWRFQVAGPVGERVSSVGGEWSRGEKAVAAVFGVAVVLWITPGVLALTGPEWLAKEWSSRLPEEVVALLAAALLFAWPIGGRAALTWSEATRIDWGTVMLFGAGIMLGELAGQTGLSARWGKALVDATGADSLWTITALVTGAAILLSEATSNTATATLMVPLAISLAQAAGVSPIPPALGVTIGASFGFMLPISTAPNAMAYGTGQVSIRQMAGAGFVFDAIGFLIVVGGLRLLCPLLGLQ